MLAPDELADGTQAVIRARLGPVRRTWVAEHFDVRAGEGFSDRQLLGPFSAWTHHHRFLPAGSAGACEMEDEISFRLPLGPLGRKLGSRAVRRQLDRLFVYRHAVVQGDAERYWRQPAVPSRGTILITGHTGLIGSGLVPLLRSLGYVVRGLTRNPSQTGEFRWQPSCGEIDRHALEGVDAVIHLAGANVAGGRWSQGRRRLILESREDSTRLIAETMARMKVPPRVLVSVSGANSYPLDGRPHDETGDRGSGFLGGVCEVWESSADAARRAGIRVVHPRISVVLSPAGGALAKMLPAYRAGLGGPIGSGDRMFSWIGMDDLLDVLVEAVENEHLEGPLNATAPEALPQRAFAQTLARVLKKPSFVKIPEQALRAALGGPMAEETLLANLNVVPGKLQALGFRWRHPELESALRHLLGRPKESTIAALQRSDRDTAEAGATSDLAGEN